MLALFLNYFTLILGGMVAHSLVRFAVNISSFLVWMESVPPHFNDIYQANLAGTS